MDTNEKFNRYKIYFFVVLFLLIITIVYLLYSTYAKYISSIDGNTTMGIAKWRITVNNTDITNGAQLSNIITPVFEGNSNIASGVIAPTAVGYFDLEIDASDTDVSLRYVITASDNPNSAVDDIVLTGYSVDGGAMQSISLNEDDEYEIERTILYTSSDKDETIRIWLQWDDSTSATMNNAADTSATYNQSNVAKLNISIKFIQVASTSGVSATSSATS